MGQINVEINNQRYNLACRDGEEERLRELAGYVSDKSKSLVQSLGNVGENRLLLMSALLIVDELFETRETMQALEGGDAGAVQEAVAKKLDGLFDDAASKLEGIAQQLESA